MLSLQTILAFLVCSCALFSITGCEQIVDDPGILPYYEKVVVRGVLEAGNTGVTLSITRTLPPLDEYTDDKAAVQGAVVILRHNGVHDTLRDQGKGRYYAPDISIQPGDIYELTVEWNGKKAFATTTIPFYPNVQAVHKTQSQSSRYDYFLVAAIVPRPNEVYGATSEYRLPPPDNGTYRSNRIYEVKHSTDTTGNGLLTIQSGSFLWYREGGTDFIRVHAYGPAYYKYFTASDDHDDNDSPFNQPTSDNQWNIQGDGIGMFIGMASTLPIEIPK